MAKSKDIIDQLKKNRYAWGMWTDDECYGPELGEKLQRALNEITIKDGAAVVERFAGEQEWVKCSNNNYATFSTPRLCDTYEEPEPEIVECEIYSKGTLFYRDIGGIQRSLSKAIECPDFAGTKFKPVFGEEIYTELWLNLDVEMNGNHKMTHASHVLFRKGE